MDGSEDKRPTVSGCDDVEWSLERNYADCVADGRVFEGLFDRCCECPSVLAFGTCQQGQGRVSVMDDGGSRD
jgi:hypothetical protein